jgi:hypothetical protein
MQVDLFDLGAHGHRKYRYVLNYTCRYTKFVWLRPLKDKTSAGVARNVSPSVLERLLLRGMQFCCWPQSK